MTRRACLLAAASAALRTGDARAQESAPAILDASRVPWVGAAGRAAYAEFVRSNLPRAFAVSEDGRHGWAGGATAAEARTAALAACAAKAPGGNAPPCVVYADGLDIVLAGRDWRAPPPPPLIGTWNYAFVPDPRFLWHGPSTAAGVYVWAHGKGGGDSRSIQPQPHVRLFNNAGWDIVRFDRDPVADDVDRATGWLHDGLVELRRRGWARIAAGGQSRGGWNCLRMLDTPGTADLLVAISPAAHGNGGSVFSGDQDDDLRRIVVNAGPSRTRMVFAQFGGDAFIGDPDARVAQISRLRPRLGGLLIIDRPGGFVGHTAGTGPAFASAFGPCILEFAMSPNPGSAC
ncbi:MAG: hypothetical protein ACRYG6_05950 [Janthinobacterium lividum]